MGLDGELKSLTRIMKTKRQNMKKSIAENLVKKRSVGRPRKSKLEKKTIHTHTPVTTKISVEKVHVHKIEKPMKSNSSISEIQVCIYIILMLCN